VPEVWMPAAVGLMFIVPLLVSVWLLAQVPPPSTADIAEKTRRVPMDAAARRAFLRTHAPVLASLICGYVMLTALRDFRDNFAREIWDALGYGVHSAIFATSEVPVALGALMGVGLMILVRDNRRALLATHALMGAGSVLIAGSTLLFQLGTIDAKAWMVVIGLGLYVGYVPFNCVLFDRLIAATGSVANASFLVTLSDALGYLGSTAMLLGKSVGKARLDWIAFFERFAYVSAAACLIFFSISALSFELGRHRRERSREGALVR
jgi:Family of unknown function (DUF5690)